MGSAALLTVSRVEDPTKVIEALDHGDISFFPRSSDDSPETTLEFKGRRFYGEADILENIDSIAASIHSAR
ncbi:hypothetical protein J7E83_11790 [Arthrobacter sp. ISL-48]|uniref:hypothetical protein n=1 Tax=Arthrobacter sp. ISL-48 TaxID=2819110 RepID=UPI001BE7F8C8|nr:hypothetical protein [Arthrobacter sp. ISL-48]MBT2532792.1 hypothetical protein [Arthrobacter sp. ISL-48]